MNSSRLRGTLALLFAAGVAFSGAACSGW